jgi:hypothetical protein
VSPYTLGPVRSPGARSDSRPPPTHGVAEAAGVAWVKLDIKGGRHYTARQLLAGGFDLRNTAARLGHSGGATTLRHYADPSPRLTAAPPHTSQTDRQVCSPERPLISAEPVQLPGLVSGALVATTGYA